MASSIAISPRALCSLAEVSRHRGFTVADADEDKDTTITQLINIVTGEVERITGRSFIRGEHTEFFDGETWRYSIPLKGKPVVSVTNLYDDPGLDYSTALATDTYVITPYGWVKLLGGGQRIGGGMFYPSKQNIKCVYVGGYALYKVQAGFNDLLRVNRTAVTPSWVNATIPPPDFGQDYTAEELAAAIDVALTAALTPDTFTVTYDSGLRKFTITSAGSTFEVMLHTAGSGWVAAHANFASLIGFDTGAPSAANKTGALAYTTNTPSGTVPDDLKWAACEWVAYLYEQTSGTGGGSNRFGISSTSGQPGTINYLAGDVPKRIIRVIRDYAGRVL